jgi:hypothetical protein
MIVEFLSQLKSPGPSAYQIRRSENGYMRVSKSDGSQAIDLQRDALIAAGVDPAQIYEDRASGRLDARPGLDAALKALRTDDTLVVWNSIDWPQPASSG